MSSYREGTFHRALKNALSSFTGVAREKIVRGGKGFHGNASAIGPREGIMQIQSSEAVTSIREASRRESLLVKLIADRLNARNVSNMGAISLLVGNLLKRSALAVRILARFISCASRLLAMGREA